MIMKDKPENSNENSLNNNNNTDDDQRIHRHYPYKTINCQVDRHHGWYTEMIPVDKQYHHYKKHPCDYIVQTNYITTKTNDPTNQSMNNSVQDNAVNSTEKSKLFSMINLSNSKILKSCKTEKIRINVILRLRSIWSRSSLKSQRIESKHIHKSFINYDHNHHHHPHHYNPRHHHHYHRHHHPQQQQQQYHHHHQHQQNSPCQQLDKKDNNDKLIKQYNTTQSMNDPLNNPLTVERLSTRQPNDNIKILLSRKYHSENCLFHPYNMHNYIHKCSHIHYHSYYNPCSNLIHNQIRNDINKLSYQLSNIKLQSSYIKHSLTTGNICCLYTLNCVPSLECIAQPISSSSSSTTTTTTTESLSSSTSASSSLSYRQHQFNQRDYRCSSLPSTSIMLNPRNKWKLISPFEKLKYHPFYKDTQCHLGKWIQQTLTNNEIDNKDQNNNNNDNNISYENELDNENTIKNPSNNQFIDITNYLNYNRLSDTFKHVHFADESIHSSLTTLNSLSRSSSLCSSNYTNGSSSPKTSYSSNQSPIENIIINDKYTGKHTFSKEIHFNHLDYQKKYSLKRTRSSHKMNSNKTPLVTVNLFHTDGELPELPLRVVNRLETEKKWEPTFPNPNQCANFNQRLIEQKICSQLLSETINDQCILVQ
ncbi:unnamed protein product [Schistosoma spindalis]|nr:unnamed protein product [Schistosoma spindale]